MPSPKETSNASSNMSAPPLLDRIRAIKELAKIEMTSDHDTRRVEIIMLKFKEEPEVIDKAISRIMHNTAWPFKLTVFDNRLNSANTSKIWNKLVRESTCDYQLIIDSDAFVPEGLSPCWLTRMMESIDETGIVVPVVDNVGGSNKATHAEKYPSAVRSTGVWGGMCFLFKKDVWKATPFDEDFYIYGQDSYWAFVHAKHYGGVVQRNDVFVHHLGSYSWKKADAAGEVDRDADKEFAGSLYRLKTKGKV